MRYKLLSFIIVIYSLTLYALPQLKWDHDIIIDNKGTIFVGKLNKIPTLRYLFGTFSLEPKEISVINTSEQGNYINIATRNGLYFSSFNPDGYFVFENQYGNTLNFSPFEIHSILTFYTDDESEIDGFYQLTFTDGSVIPIILSHENFDIETDKGPISFPFNRLNDLHFNGFIHGKYFNKKDKLRKFTFGYPNQSHLKAKIATNNQSIIVPWEEISGLERHGHGYKNQMIVSALNELNQEHFHTSFLTKTINSPKATKSEYLFVVESEKKIESIEKEIKRLNEALQHYRLKASNAETESENYMLEDWSLYNEKLEDAQRYKRMVKSLEMQINKLTKEKILLKKTD